MLCLWAQLPNSVHHPSPHTPGLHTPIRNVLNTHGVFPHLWLSWPSRVAPKTSRCKLVELQQLLPHQKQGTERLSGLTPTCPLVQHNSNAIVGRSFFSRAKPFKGAFKNHGLRSPPPWRSRIPTADLSAQQQVCDSQITTNLKPMKSTKENVASGSEHHEVLCAKTWTLATSTLRRQHRHPRAKQSGAK